MRPFGGARNPRSPFVASAPHHATRLRTSEGSTVGAADRPRAFAPRLPCKTAESGDLRRVGSPSPRPLWGRLPWLGSCFSVRRALIYTALGGGPGHAGRSLRAPSGVTERTVRSTTLGEARPAVRAPRGQGGVWSPGHLRRRGWFAVRSGYGGRSSPRGRREAGRPSGLTVRWEDEPGWTCRHGGGVHG